MRHRWHQLVGLALAPSIALSAFAAPEHAHESDADHPHTVVHRHSSVHVDRDHDGTISEHDQDAVWISADAIQGAQQNLRYAPDVTPIALVSGKEHGVRSGLVVSYDASLPHGPPGSCQQLRGPPTLLV